jgi:hypothetical protein
MNSMNRAIIRKHTAVKAPAVIVAKAIAATAEKGCCPE